MALQLVFSGNLDPASANLSSRFTEATAFFIEAPLLNAELEIDVYLQVYLPGILGEVARNIPLGKISDTALLLNISDTETSQVIPSEYQNTGLEMALLFLASDTTFLYATVVKPDCNLCQLSAQLNQLETKVDEILDAVLVGQPSGNGNGNNNDNGNQIAPVGLAANEENFFIFL